MLTEAEQDLDEPVLCLTEWPVVRFLRIDISTTSDAPSPSAQLVHVLFQPVHGNVICESLSAHPVPPRPLDNPSVALCQEPRTALHTFPTRPKAKRSMPCPSFTRERTAGSTSSAPLAVAPRCHLKATPRQAAPHRAVPHRAAMRAALRSPPPGPRLPQAMWLWMTLVCVSS
eukprot:5002193-Prymnesium_polylepis.1